MALTLKNVLISDEVDPQCIEILRKNGIDVTKNTKLSKEELIAEIPKYDGLIVRSATRVTADVINASNLKIIGRAGTGVDNIDCDAATKKGIIVMNTPGGNTLSAAEHTCALICALSRDIPNAVQSMKEGRWDRKKYMGSELNGKTLAIIGLGRIGKEVALRMQSFGMKTIGYDPIVPAEVSSEFGVKWLPLEEIWPQADYITIHVPLIPQTKNLINEQVFAKCKPTLRVLNVARGGIIDEQALLKALNSNQCAGAALDVYEEEPPKDYTLAQHPLVIGTPHLGANTVEAQERVALEIAEQFVDAVKGKSLFGAINAQALVNALSQETKPWVELGRYLGVVAATLSENKPQNLQVTSYGSQMQNAGSYMSAAVLAGMLSKTSVSGCGKCTSLNLINAPVFAKEQGIKVDTKYEADAPAPYGKLVTVTLQSGLQLSGTTSGAQALLVKIQESLFLVPPTLTGSLLIFKAASSPQLLSSVAVALANAGALAENVSLSTEVGGQRWGVANLTISPSQQVVQALASVVQLVVSVAF
ncbi:hypothetical protein CHS0354_043027 [Potamilus streckersoni]|uniref:D-3-phosphoglycerate dehydrogenase n=1 Tax=Potamilus streckersoni TaxID=2493646 RepID=A0AAE0VT20_9BIVA|nr:hypothetical protein CHS0354_043027 [Potamilus streckersoni]